jgi:hypothetical protein
MSAVVVIEIEPGLFRPAGPDPLGPFLEFYVGVVVPIPAKRPVKSHVDFLSRFDEFVGSVRMRQRQH